MKAYFPGFKVRIGPDRIKDSTHGGSILHVDLELVIRALNNIINILYLIMIIIVWYA